MCAADSDARGRARRSSPDGVFFSNGPGDPATRRRHVELLQGLLDARRAVFGICFGNQLLGRALGFGTYKLNVRPPRHQPAGAGPTTGKVEVTAHNHGFAVDAPLDRVVGHGRTDASR